MATGGFFEEANRSCGSRVHDRTALSPVRFLAVRHLTHGILDRFGQSSICVIWGSAADK